MLLARAARSFAARAPQRASGGLFQRSAPALRGGGYGGHHVREILSPFKPRSWWHVRDSISGAAGNSGGIVTTTSFCI